MLCQYVTRFEENKKGCVLLSNMAKGLCSDYELTTNNCKISDVNQPFRGNSCFKCKCELELTEELIPT